MHQHDAQLSKYWCVHKLSCCVLQGVLVSYVMYNNINVYNTVENLLVAPILVIIASCALHSHFL